MNSTFMTPLMSFMTPLMSFMTPLMSFMEPLFTIPSSAEATNLYLDYMVLIGTFACLSGVALLILLSYAIVCAIPMAIRISYHMKLSLVRRIDENLNSMNQFRISCLHFFQDYLNDFVSKIRRIRTNILTYTTSLANTPRGITLLSIYPSHAMKWVRKLRADFTITYQVVNGVVIGHVVIYLISKVF
jgi:hypothetical protein